MAFTKYLEKELKRKEKALAEAAALFGAAKKVQVIRGGPGERMISTPDRRRTVMLINEAGDAGARLEPACRVVGVCSRTYQRWTCENEIKVDGCPTGREAKTIMIRGMGASLSGPDCAEAGGQRCVYRLRVRFLPDSP